MSHVLVIELPGGSDGDILAAVLAGGHRFSFLTAAPAQYRAQPSLAALLDRAEHVLAAPGFALGEVAALVDRAHLATPFDAILCLQDLRIVESAQIARRLGLRYLDPQTAALARDKAAVRQRLADSGLAQPAFRAVRGSAQLLRAVAELGLPLLIKPVDGFGSQNIFALRTPADCAALAAMPDLVSTGPGDYGLGVAACGTMLVERLLEGQLVGCDTMSATGRHMLLGVNDKQFFAPSSFAISGGCFTTNIGQYAQLEAWLFRLLDAVGFDHGAAHIEVMLTADGPQLVEINPRLVGARIPRLLSAALGRPVHRDLIDLHLHGCLPPASDNLAHAVTRWLTAPVAGTLASITVPPSDAPGIVEATLLCHPGDPVSPPYDNADRLGYVMTCADDRRMAESLAEAFVAASEIRVDATNMASAAA